MVRSKSHGDGRVHSDAEKVKSMAHTVSKASFMMTMWGEYVQMALSLGEARLKFAQPSFVRRFADGADVMARVACGEVVLSYSASEEEARRQEVRERLLRDW